VSRDEADARDKATRRVALQPIQASSSALTDVTHRSAFSSSPELDRNKMKSLKFFPDRL